MIKTSRYTTTAILSEKAKNSEFMIGNNDDTGHTYMYLRKIKANKTHGVTKADVMPAFMVVVS